MGHQADPAHCNKFHILQQICSTQYFTILFWDWGRQQKARINSQWYNTRIVFNLPNGALVDQQAMTLASLKGLYLRGLSWIHCTLPYRCAWLQLQKRGCLRGHWVCGAFPHTEGGQIKHSASQDMVDQTGMRGEGDKEISDNRDSVLVGVSWLASFTAHYHWHCSVSKCTCLGRTKQGHLKYQV